MFRSEMLNRPRLKTVEILNIFVEILNLAIFARSRYCINFVEIVKHVRDAGSLHPLEFPSHLWTHGHVAWIQYLDMLDSVSRKRGFGISPTITPSQHLATPTAIDRDSVSPHFQKCVDIYITKRQIKNSIYISIQLSGIA